MSLPSTTPPVGSEVNADQVACLLHSLTPSLPIFSVEWFRQLSVINQIAKLAVREQSALSSTVGVLPSDNVGGTIDAEPTSLFEHNLFVAQLFVTVVGRIDTLIYMLTEYKEISTRPENQLEGYKPMIRRISEASGIAPALVSAQLVQFEVDAGTLLACIFQNKEAFQVVRPSVFLELIHVALSAQNICVVGDQDVKLSQESLAVLYLFQLAQVMDDLDAPVWYHELVENSTISELLLHMRNHHRRFPVEWGLRALCAISLLLQTEDGQCLASELIPNDEVAGIVKYFWEKLVVKRRLPFGPRRRIARGISHFIDSFFS